MKICKNPSDAEFYGESNGEINNGGLVLHFLSYRPDKFWKVLKMCPKMFNQKS